MYVVVSALLLALVVGALVDIITSEQWRIKHLPKAFWIIIVILMPLIGSVLWFAIGREYARPIDRGGFGDPRRREQPAPAVGDSVSRGSRPGGSLLGYSGRNDSGQNDSGRDDSGLSATERELAALEREIVASEKADRIRRLEEKLQARREVENPGDQPAGTR